MPKNMNGNGTNGDHQVADKSPLESATEKVETVKTSIKSAISGLNELLDTLKQVQRDQKSTDKEVQSVRTTLERLQSVKLRLAEQPKARTEDRKSLNNGVSSLTSFSLQ